MTFDGQLATVADYEHHARQATAPALFDFYYGSHGDPQWSTHTSNRSAFHALKLRPRVLVDVSTRTLATTFLGHELRLPVIVGPTGLLGMHDPLGDVPTARAASTAGTAMALSGVSTAPAEAIAAAVAGRPWFQQVWLLENRSLTEWPVRHAVELGASAIVLTVSNSADPWHTLPLRFPGAWEAQMVGPATNLAGYDRAGEITLLDIVKSISPSATWSDVDWLRSLTPAPLIVKGIQTAEDAELCVAHGVDAIVVSNHGGRFLQGARGTMEALPEIVEAVAGRIEVCLDGGVRQGQDVLKALALGARAVWIGRAARWGATVSSDQGVASVIDILARELEGTMALCGVTDVNAVPQSVVAYGCAPTMEA